MTDPTNDSTYTTEEPPIEDNSDRARRVFWQGKFGPAFWTITGVLSLVVNIILIIIVIILGQQLFVLNDIVENGLIGGLHRNFVAMDEATIVTKVTVEDTIPVQFDLPVVAKTTVVLTEPTPIEGASVVISTGVLNINAPADIVLPAGLELPIELGITVPVDQEVPVVLEVPVNIPLNQTELHEPFVGLQQVVEPYHGLLGELPDSWEETPLCQGVAGQVCVLLINTE
jgi:hypothetical protein